MSERPSPASAPGPRRKGRGGRRPNTDNSAKGGARKGAKNTAKNTAKTAGRRPDSTPLSEGSASRRLAIDALLRIDRGGAFANLVLPEMLDRSDLKDEDRHFVTELVYGTTRMRRACDHLVDRFVLDEVEPEVRAALRLGAYQLVFLATPPHAAVDATVGAVKGRGRSVVNAVLRRVASASVDYPDEATELSYPDWIVDRLRADLGGDRAMAALVAMNERATVHVRDDGYVQDEASQLVVAAVGAEPGQVVVDLCAAPGGKATGLAATGATVIASDLRAKRVGLIAENVSRLGARLPLLVAEGTAPPLRPGSADRVLIDAPCSGLGSLRRRADARWRIDDDAPERLAKLQTRLVMAGLDLLRPGGVLVYSVCTLTAAEGVGVLDAVLSELRGGDHGGLVPSPTFEVLEPPDGPWETEGGAAILLPAGSDGMVLFRLRRTA